MANRNRDTFARQDRWKHHLLPVCRLAVAASACVWRPSFLLRCLVLFGLLAANVSAQPASSANSIVRIGFSARSLGNANRSDVTASVKVWLQAVARERHLTADPIPEVYDSIGDMANALRREQIDVISAPTDEFLVLEKVVPLWRLFASKVNGKITEQYVLLVHRDRAINSLKELRGETIVVMDSPRTALAPLWLETELMQNKLPIGTRFFGKITYASKSNLAILPVFFKQAGAALVTRSNFEIAGELNPQLSKEIRVLAFSPELIPTIGAFRSNATSVAVDLYRKEAMKLIDTPAGKLVLNLFQAEGITELKESDLSGTRAFLAEYARLKAEAERKGAAP